ncbi:potassium channel family protein [Streptomyces sp. NPDC004542]|uniref:potassium channel family protein n=1 Tax=Streptomyces sp. NPDC004542 TaxID=3154281 RepID=UPI0033B0A6E5
MSDPPAARPDDSGAGQNRRPRARWRRSRGWTAGVVTVRVLITVTVLVIAYYNLPLEEHNTAGALTLLVGGLLGVLLVFAWQAWAIVRSPHPRLKAMEALAVTVALFLVVFADAYYLMERATPATFTQPLTRTDSLYFTLTTFSTVGFGDITPYSETGRVVAMLQMAGGLLLLGGAVRVLSGAVRVGLRRQRRGPPAGPDRGTGSTAPDRKAGP